MVVPRGRRLRRRGWNGEDEGGFALFGDADQAAAAMEAGAR